MTPEEAAEWERQYLSRDPESDATRRLARSVKIASQDMTGARRSIAPDRWEKIVAQYPGTIRQIRDQILQSHPHEYEGADYEP